MRSWASVLVAGFLLIAGVVSGAGVAATETDSPAAAGDDTAFCGFWSAARESLVGVISGSQSFDVLAQEGEHHEFAEELDSTRRELAQVDPIVPEEVRADWDNAYQTFGTVVELMAVADSAGGLRPAIIDMAFAGQDMEVVLGDALDSVKAIDTWARANCPKAKTGTGTPGTVTVRLSPPKQINLGETWLVALLPAGTDFADVTHKSTLIALSCPNSQQLEHEWWRLEHGEPASSVFEPLRPAVHVGGGADRVCQADWESTAVVPGGPYELFVGTYPSDPGTYGLYVEAPQRCLQKSIRVNGDTVARVPPLKRCDIPPVGDPAEIARRNPPPAKPGGTLEVRLDNARAPEAGGPDQMCSVDAALLPSGTTLNEVGRGEVWPTASFSFGLMPPERGEARDQRVIGRPGNVPLLAYPGAGGAGPGVYAEEGLDGWGAGGWDAGMPDPVPVPAGTYDLRIRQACESDDGEPVENLARCGETTVKVAGATVVKAPKLRTCP